MASVALRVFSRGLFLRRVSLVVVVLVLVTLCGCSSTDRLFADAGPPVEYRVLCDATSSACSATTLQRLLRALVGEHPGATVSLYRLDAHAGAVRVARFAPTKPPSQAKKALGLHRESMIREAEKFFDAVIPTIFVNVPRSSPLSAGILTASENRTGSVELYVLTDAREVGPLANFEKGPLPDVDAWHAGLASIGYNDDSLDGVTIHFLGMPLIAPGDPDASPAQGLAIQNLWRELEAFGAKQVLFDEEQHAAVLLILAPLAYYWRRFRSWMTGRFDGKRDFYAPVLAVESLLGPKPLPEYDDPEVGEAARTAHEQRGVIDSLAGELRELSRALTRLPHYFFPCLFLVLAFFGDLAGSDSLFKDLGAMPPERWIFSVAFVLFLFVLAGFAGNAAKVSGRLPKWWYLVIVCIALLTISLTAVRVMSAATTGDPLFGEIARGIVQLAATVGPALLAEVLLEKLRMIMPVWRLKWSLSWQLRKGQREYKRALDFQARQARLRRAWEWESTVLRAIYERAYMASGGKRPSPPTVDIPIIAALTTAPPNNGLPSSPDQNNGDRSHGVVAERPITTSGTDHAKPNGLPVWPE